MSIKGSNNKKKSLFALKVLIGALSLLPWWLLYCVSNVLAPVMEHVVKYRRRIVEKNLRNSFPEMSDKELRRVRKKFYRNFLDYMVETIKLSSMSEKEMMRRMVFKGEDISDSYLAQNRPVVIYFSHCGNWEWATSVLLWSKFRNDSRIGMFQVYRPLRNAVFDNLMLDLRSRFGTVSIPKRTAFLDLMRYKKANRPTMTGFMSDQKPSHGDPLYIIKFLNQPTAVITGTEVVARRLDAAVVYWDMRRVKRGYYEIEVKLITATPSEMPENSITNSYFSLLEQSITRQPDIWLWSHNRWKGDYGFADNQPGRKYG